MLNHDRTNLGIVNTQLQRNQQYSNSTPFSGDLLQQMQLLEKRVKSLEVMNKVTLGLLIGMAMAVGTGFAIAAAPVIAGSIVGGILVTTAFVALGVAINRHKVEIKNGFKCAADKTRDGVVCARDSVKEAVSCMKQAVREETSSALKIVGNKMNDFGRNMSDLDEILYSVGQQDQTVVLKTEEKTKNFNSVKEMFVKEVFEDKTVGNSVLMKKIFSELKGKILEKAYSVGGQQGFKKDQLINQLGQQADFVSKLNAKKLLNLLTQNDNNLYEIFSEHHDEIKRVVKKCKIEHKLSNVMEKLNGAAKRYVGERGSMQFIDSSLENSSLDVGSIKADTAINSNLGSKRFVTINYNLLKRSPSFNSLNSSSAGSRMNLLGSSSKSVMITGLGCKVKQQPSTNIDVRTDVQLHTPMQVVAASR
ncbi:actin-bundling T4SS effector WalE1 family protein [Wolbachia endosymbiont of Dirofilaria (Dirofilaria) immitis]|uniref:actin-bundling T4SS effector WalE1 family protein n=1 Tax=Wolbachia endosymbiont of Dirofilaria (Dirofilaria) immitis TaxID=1812115 RepID=UPI00158BEC0C|nr:hypothetical protein [Wolbachia endosymbiont of Dirofilaria (Dirofilaria) immitis]QKX02257.1 hypothetical protein GOY12_01600 [Wolbachia endosymbiont of Dirofilaria (Dirofilaria) immitis]